MTEFKANCIDGEEHIPDVDTVDTFCQKCGKNIHETGEYSGHWFTDEDDVNWDKMYNGGELING